MEGYRISLLEVTSSARRDMLLGRDILNQFIITLNGKDLTFEIVDPQIQTLAEVIIVVKRIPIKETQAAYAVPVSEHDLAEGPVILERNGKAVAALIPIEEYRRFVSWQERQEKEARHRARLKALEQERQAFLRLKPELLRTHEGLYVAIHNGQVVDSDRDNRELAQRMYARSCRPVYIELVSEEPRTAEFPSPEVVVRDA